MFCRSDRSSILTMHVTSLPRPMLFVSCLLHLLAATARGQEMQASANSGVVEGRVLGQDGEPMVGIEVWGVVWPDTSTVVARTRTDGDGMFVLPHLPLQTVWIHAAAGGCTVGFAVAALAPDEPRTGVQLRLWQANTLRGRILDPDGKPVPGVHVLGTRDMTWFAGNFQPAETQTDREGCFELRGVPIGDCCVRAWAPGFAMREWVQEFLADGTLDLTMQRGAGASLRIRAEGLPAGGPAATVWIHAIRGAGFDLPHCLESCELGRDGQLQLEGLPDAEWNVEGHYRFLGVRPGGHRVELDTMRKLRGSSPPFAVEPGAVVQQELSADR
jgi:hypothetical protein